MTEVRSRGLVGLVFSFGLLACGPEGGSEKRAPTESTHERLTPITATWTAEGPGPIIQGQVENLASNPAGFPSTNPNGNQVTGAIHAIVAHPTDPNRIVIGAVNGGIWTTDNALSNPPTWTPRTNLARSPSIGALAIDPTNSNVLLAGFGATSSFNRLGGTRAGLIRSDDFGQTWTRVEPVSTIRPDGRNIWSVAIRGDLMLSADISSSAGIIRSTDGGQNWTGVNGLGSGTVFDMVSDPTNGDRYYAAVGGQGIYRSDNGGLDWVLASGPTSCPAPEPVGCDLLFQSIAGSFPTSHIELAVGSGGRVYVVVINSPFPIFENNHQPAFIGYTDNQGNTWTTMDIPRLPASTPITVTNASNTNPIVVTLSSAFPLNFSDGFPTRRVRVSGVTGNTAANGDFRFSCADSLCTMITLGVCYTSPGCTAAGNGDYLGGGTVTSFDTPHPREGANFAGGQGNIHLSIGVDPTNQGIVYLGGDRQDTSTLFFNGGRNLIGADDFTGNLWRGDTSVPPTGTPPGTGTGPSGVIPSPQWAHLTHDVGAPGIPTGGTASGSAPHADSRDIAFDANGNLLQSDDGGIYRRTSPLTNTGDWFSMIGNLQVTELSNIAFDPVTNTVFGGTQDVGNPQQISPGGATWLTAFRGDGADVQVDTRTRPGFSVRFIAREAFQSAQRCAFNPAGQPVDSSGNPTIPGINCDFLNLFLRCPGTTPCDDGMGGTFPNDVPPSGFPFQTALGLNEFDPANTARVIIIAGNSAYESLDGGDTIFQLRNAGGTPVGGSTRFETVPLVAGHPLDSELVYLGTFSFLSRTSATGTLDPTPFQPVGFGLNGIAVDPANPAIVYVATNAAVSWSADGGTTAWTDITGDLFDPAQPVQPGVLRSLAFVPGTPARLYLGTSAGVFMTTTASLGTWGQVGAGSLPNSLVVDFDYDQASDRLFAGTFGRGAFSLANASSVGGNLPPVASCVPLVERPAEAMCLAAITVFDVDAGSSDPDGPPPTCTLSPTGPFGPGTFTVTLTCVDSFGASDSCESTVIVEDDTPPTFTSVPADISTTTCGSPSLGTPVATDNCDPTVTITNNAPTQFPPGTTLVTWTATDDAGNVTTATQRVTLILTDNQACCPAGTNIMLGNSNDNFLNGTNGADCILGRGAQDIINGNGGNDFISGGDGNDTINGGGGNDVIFGGSGQDPIIGGTGNDTIFGGDGDDNIQGGANDDVLNGGQGQDTLLGQDGNDQLNGDDGDDNLQGGNDNDTLVGGTNNDTCNGGTGINTFAQCEFGAPNSCTNGVQDGTETDLNCGGACPKCPNGDLCITGNDCQSGLCSNGTCEPQTGGGGGGALSTNLTISTDWGGGYCATLNVTNSGTTPTTSFTVDLNTNASTIYTSWNGNFVGSSGPVSVTPCCSWNTVVDPGETETSIGFCANRTVSGSGTLPFVVSTTGVF